MEEQVANTDNIFHLIESVTEVAWPELFGDKGTVIDEEKVCVISEINHMFTNSMFRIRFQNDNIENEINNIVDVFKQRKSPTIWYISPSTKPSNIGLSLEKCGLRKEFELSGMSIDLQNDLKHIQNPKDVEIIEVLTETEFDAWIDVQVAVFAFPRLGLHTKFFPLWKKGLETNCWRLYLGKLNDKPVAGSCAQFCTNEFSNASQVIGIFMVAVLSEARNKGMGKGITHIALLEGKKRGYKYAVLYATDLGYPVYLQLGFKDWFKFPCYLYQP